MVYNINKGEVASLIVLFNDKYIYTYNRGVDMVSVYDYDRQLLGSVKDEKRQ